MPFFFLYLNIRGLRKGPGKFFMWSWKVLEKSWIFLSVKEWEPCVSLLCLPASSIARVISLADFSRLFLRHFLITFCYAPAP